MTKCVISLGVGQQYEKGLLRLAAGLDYHGFSGDRHILSEYPKGCPTHDEIPYGFKPWLFSWAKGRGYDSVLWMDSACVPVKSLNGVFEKLGRQGTIMPYSPFRVWEWCSDACAETMGVSRAKLRGYCPSLWACVMGLDFRQDIASQFLGGWLKRSVDGISFHGAFTNEGGQVSADPQVKGHRHDQTVAAILDFELGIPFDWDIVAYDVADIMPLEGWGNALDQPHFPAPILSNHNVKTRKHAN